MLDPATMVLLGKLKNLAKQAGTNIDLVRMNADKRYAERVLEELGHSSDDPELVLIVIQLMNLFGMIKVPALQAKDEEANGKSRYVGSLR